MPEPALDEAVVASITRIGVEAGEDLWAALVALFLAEAESWLPAMRAAVAAVDAAALFRSAHTLCGTSANVGATHLAALSSTLARTGLGDELESTPVAVAVAVDAVEVELERVVVALRASVV